MTAPDSASRELAIAFLYLDLTHCTRCGDTRKALLSAIETAAPALDALNTTISLSETHITSSEQARAQQFSVSPTVRINGRDIQPERHQSPCQECGDLCNCSDGMDCRVWAWRGAMHTSPPVALFVDRILRAATEADAAAGTAVHKASSVDGDIETIDRFFKQAPEPAACCAPGCCQ